MEIKRYEKNGYIVLSITEDLNIRSNITELKTIIQSYLEQGYYNIVVSFTQNSFLSSAAVSVCIQCVEQVRERGAKLGIIHPSEQISEVLKITELFDQVIVFESEDSLRKNV